MTGVQTCALPISILVVKSDRLAATGKKWKMNAVRAEKIMKDVRFSDDAKLVKCTMDELVSAASYCSICTALHL